jgi:hypothetical protein
VGLRAPLTPITDAPTTPRLGASCENFSRSHLSEELEYDIAVKGLHNMIMARVGLLSAILFETTFCARAQEARWVELIEKVQGSVVVIQTDKGTGTGFFVRKNGVIATNRHVIAGSQQVMVRVQNGEMYDQAHVLAEDDSRDIAILKIDAVDTPFLALGDSNSVRPGEEVLLIGTPKGLDQTISTGIVSSVRVLDRETKVIQTTAPASPGSSGGPLLNRNGDVIGVLTFGLVEGQNLNFAMPSNYVRGVLDNLSLVPPLSPIRTLTKLEPKGTATNGSEISTGAPGTISAEPIRSVLFFAYRTSRHVQYSSPEVFEHLLESVLLSLRSMSISLVDNRLRAALQTNERPASVYQAIQLNERSIGASHIIVMTVDRPLAAWVKVTLQCVKREGATLWQETATRTNWVSSNLEPTIEAIKRAVHKHIVNLPIGPAEGH